jgi:hypothetical protein
MSRRQRKQFFRGIFLYFGETSRKYMRYISPQLARLFYSKILRRRKEGEGQWINLMLKRYAYGFTLAAV